MFPGLNKNPLTISTFLVQYTTNAEKYSGGKFEEVDSRKI